mgnify:CR=1 FL=1
MNTKKPSLECSEHYSESPGYAHNRDPKWEKTIEIKATSKWMKNPLTRAFNASFGFLWPLCHRYNYSVLFDKSFQANASYSSKQFGVVITPAIIIYAFFLPLVLSILLFSTLTNGILGFLLFFSLSWWGAGLKFQNTHNNGNSLSYKLFEAGESDSAVVRDALGGISCTPTKSSRVYVRKSNGDVLVYFFDNMSGENPLKHVSLDDIFSGNQLALEVNKVRTPGEASSPAERVIVPTMVIPKNLLPSHAFYNFRKDKAYEALLPGNPNKR